MIAWLFTEDLSQIEYFEILFSITCWSDTLQANGYPYNFTKECNTRASSAYTEIITSEAQKSNGCDNRSTDLLKPESYSLFLAKFR